MLTHAPPEPRRLVVAADVLLRTLLAPVCAGCAQPLDRPLQGPICDVCRASIRRVPGPLCVQCGEPIVAVRSPDGRCPRCLVTPRAFTTARSAGRYEGVLRTLIHGLKYQRRRALARPLADLIRSAASDLLDDADGVVPVPLHPWRTFRRGFNQADDLACCLGRPVWRVLRRRRLGRPQARLPAGDRRLNVSDAFALAVLPRARTRDLARRTLVLVDDVMTTGETLEACSAVLRAAGVQTVRAVTVARAAAGPLP